MDWRYVIEKFMTGNFDLEQGLVSKNKESFWRPRPGKIQI